MTKNFAAAAAVVLFLLLNGQSFVPALAAFLTPGPCSGAICISAKEQANYYYYYYYRPAPLLRSLAAALFCRTPPFSAL